MSGALTLVGTQRAWLALCITTLVGVLPGTVLAWGDEGHRFIARLAESRLAPATARQVDELLRLEAVHGVPGCTVNSLADAAVWADCLRRYRSEWSHTFAWHYDDIPLCGEANRETYCPDGNCLSAQTTRLLAVLADSHAPERRRLEALKFIAHFIGDAHQPLHAADNHDRGGNDVPLRVPSAQEPRMNLHRLWDTELVERSLQTGRRRSLSGAASAPEGPTFDASQAALWANGTVFEWMAESHALAVREVYPRLPAPPACDTGDKRPAFGQPAETRSRRVPDRQTVDDRYIEAEADTVREQLLKAGVRLAEVLNRALR